MKTNTKAARHAFSIQREVNINIPMSNKLKQTNIQLGAARKAVAEIFKVSELNEIPFLQKDLCS